MRILLVEDEALIALNARTLLIAAGHEIVGPYRTHDDALAAAVREKPDIAMVDINLAGHDEGLAIVRALHDRCGIRSVYATGQPHVARVNNDTALGVLTKPYSDADLVNAFPVLEAILGGASPPPPIVPYGLELFG